MDSNLKPPLKLNEANLADTSPSVGNRFQSGFTNWSDSLDNSLSFLNYYDFYLNSCVLSPQQSVLCFCWPFTYHWPYVHFLIKKEIFGNFKDFLDSMTCYTRFFVKISWVIWCIKSSCLKKRFKFLILLLENWKIGIIIISESSSYLFIFVCLYSVH